VFHPEDKQASKEQILPIFIPEEYEKQSAVPLWKIRLVKEMLPYMITDEDEGADFDIDEENPFSVLPSGAATVKKLDNLEHVKGLCCLLRPEDRLNSKEVVGYLKALQEVQKKVKDPLDDIEAIFNKIQKWKQKMGDLDQQEKGVG